MVPIERFIILNIHTLLWVACIKGEKLWLIYVKRLNTFPVCVIPSQQHFLAESKEAMQGFTAEKYLCSRTCSLSNSLLFNLQPKGKEWREEWIHWVFEDNSAQWKETSLLSSEENSVSCTSEYVDVSPKKLTGDVLSRSRTCSAHLQQAKNLFSLARLSSSSENLCPCTETSSSEREEYFQPLRGWSQPESSQQTHKDVTFFTSKLQRSWKPNLSQKENNTDYWVLAQCNLYLL